MVNIYAHRGASAEFPENTLAAFARSVELGAYGVELDVHLSADGVPIVLHDDSVDRTTNGTGDVASFTVAELHELDAGGSEPVPTLDEVLVLVGDKVHVNIEVKAAAAADEVLVVAARHPGLRFAISSFNHDVLRHVHNVDPLIELWPLTLGATDETLATAGEIGATQINIYDKFVNEEIVEFARNQGLGLWVWTVNDPDRAIELASWSVVGLCTDDPAALLHKLG